jgi:hypothetical protein
MKRQFISVGGILLLALFAHAQSRPQKVDYFPAQDIQKQLADLAPKA